MRNFIAFLLIVLSAISCSTVEDQPQIVAVEVYFNDGTLPVFDTINCKEEDLDLSEVVSSLQLWAYEDTTIYNLAIEVNGQKFWSFKGYD